MTFNPWFLPFLGVVAVAVLYVVVPLAIAGYLRFRNGATVLCPMEAADATVRLTPLSTLQAELRPRMRLQVAGCSLWPRRAGCEQSCMATRPLAS